jgi:hypothetical protein
MILGIMRVVLAVLASLFKSKSRARRGERGASAAIDCFATQGKVSGQADERPTIGSLFRFE